MIAKFVAHESNLTAIATVLTKNNTAGFTQLNIDEAKEKLVANIKRAYSNAVAENGIDKVLTYESSWMVWKGVIVFFIPISSCAGYETIFEENAGANQLVEIVLYYALFQNDIDALS